jgi:hypothetical protein
MKIVTLLIIFLHPGTPDVTYTAQYRTMKECVAAADELYEATTKHRIPMRVECHAR